MRAVNVLLFDIDGVLIEPRAYRICINRTLELLLPKIGITDPYAFLPSESDVSYFEAQGVHDCWDITNIIYAQILASARNIPRSEAVPVPNYRLFVDRIKSADAGSHPPTVAVSLLSLDSDANAGNETALAEWLRGSRSVYRSHVTRVFQNILLGPTIFESTYNLPSLYDGGPLLEAEDRVLISNRTVTKLKELHARAPQSWKTAVYTARPSLKPQFGGGDSAGYSPEAEIAQQSAGLNQFPLVGMGTMEFLAERKNELPQDLVKPNSTQAFTALLAALHGSLSLELLEQGYGMGMNEVSPDDTALFAWKQIALNVCIFEDTVSGIIPMDIITSRLNEQGFCIRLNRLGIARQDSKRKALSKLGAAVYDDVNDAFASAIANTAQDAIEGSK